jgi:hypothetical protein
MIPFFISFLTCLSAFFRSRYYLSLEILALRQQLGVLKENILVLGWESRIGYFGFCSAGFGLNGGTSWSLSNQKPLSPGIGPAFGCSGAFDRTTRALAGQRSMPRFDLSSGRW